MALAIRDRVWAGSLHRSLAAAGVEVGAMLSGDRPPVQGELADTDVLLIEVHSMGDPHWRLMERIRELSPLVEVVAISCEETVEEVVRALRQGAFAVLEHPVRAAELARTVLGAGNRKRTAEQRMRQLEGPVETARRQP